MSIEKLIDLAREASTRSYSPYSRFPVGCAIETADGDFFTGCNVENISFGLSMCAERSAVFSAISRCGPNLRIRRVVIYTPTEEAITPCGACRQVLREFGNDFEVVSVNKNGKMLGFTIDQLLPDSPDIRFRESDK